MALALKKQFPFVERDFNWDIGKYIKKYQYTPDISTLQMGKHWYVFEYGECMKDHRDHQEFIDDEAKLIGAAFTKYSNFIMYKKDLGSHSYPVILAHSPKPPGIWFKTNSLDPMVRNSNTRVTRARHPFVIKDQPGRVKGELYIISGHKAILTLDKLRENTVSFRRVRLPILFPYTKTVWNEVTGSWMSEEFMEVIPAWIYVGIKKYWDGILDAGYSSHLVHKFQHVANRTEYASHVMGDYFFYSKLELIDDADRNKNRTPF